MASTPTSPHAVPSQSYSILILQPAYKTRDIPTRTNRLQRHPRRPRYPMPSHSRGAGPKPKRAMPPPHASTSRERAPPNRPLDVAHVHISCSPRPTHNYRSQSSKQPLSPNPNAALSTSLRGPSVAVAQRYDRESNPDGQRLAGRRGEKLGRPGRTGRGGIYIWVRGAVPPIECSTVRMCALSFPCCHPVCFINRVASPAA